MSVLACIPGLAVDLARWLKRVGFAEVVRTVHLGPQALLIWTSLSPLSILFFYRKLSTKH
jgi:hypothetical protein